MLVLGPEPGQEGRLWATSHSRVPVDGAVIVNDVRESSCREQKKTTRRTLDQFGISDRAGAAIVSAALQDVDIISESNVLNVVDRNKIRRERTKARTTLLSQVIKDYDHDQFGLYFDGRKDRTLSMEDNRRKVIIEEHISLVKEPGFEHIGHVSVNFGRAQIIGNNIYSIFVMRCQCHRCNKVGCDGKSVNTGVKGGIIRNMELILNRPLQWFVCQLHVNDLPLRHLFVHVDRTTTGPRSLTGEIRKSLVGCEKLFVVSSTPIENTLCEVTNKKDLITYQLYLMEICEVINC
ncbi:hypothetical protein AVEN_271122-1 [Araneus ventricosus]|uniref:Uncharacterized protein n=1 Tax=Araneus ventricosus TaxID=182803 RepID=A0A4Y2E632_ARAVE|nr:hypothetical protein AVEN_271122-1 [Araneus ventricosus]